MLRLKTFNNTVLLLSSFLFLIYRPAVAQDWQWVRDDLLINPSGVQSFGAARIDVGDIDGDSWLDLVVLDSVGMRMYQNRGLSTSISFQRRPDWKIDPILVGDEIPSLADLNGDGRADFILPDNQTSSLRFWLNTGNVSDNFWTRADSMLQTIVGNHFVAFADLDNDQDLDAITRFDSRLKLYWNTGNSVNPKWQPDPKPFAISFYNGQPNNIRFADVDGDGLLDLFAGFNWAWTDAIVGVGWNKSASDPMIFDFPSHFRSLASYFHFGPVLNVRNITIAVGDLDRDGKLDLLTGHESPFLHLWNSDFDPSRIAFNHRGILGFPFGFLEAGISIINWDESNPQEMILVDVEPGTDIWSGSLRFTKYFRDNSLWLRDTIPALNLQDHPLFAPTLNRFDWDGDGHDDFALGANRGTPWSAQISETVLMYFTNSKPQPSFLSDFPPDSLFQDPSLIDINGDGMLDLLIQQSQHYTFYENVGTLSSPKWEKRPQWSAGLTNNKHYRAEAGDVTGDGLLDILFGESDGTLSFFRNAGTPNLPQWEQDDRVFENVRVDSFAIPTLVDLDYDSDLDLILGDRLGRFVAFRNDLTPSVSDDTSEVVISQQPRLFQIYPNPFNTSAALAFTLSRPQQVSIKIYDILGREVEILLNEERASGFHTLKWTPQDLPSGAYFIQIETEEFTETKKVVFQK